MKKNKEPATLSGTSCCVATSTRSASAESITSYPTDSVAGIRIDSFPSSFIETKDGVQGGRYCLRGTRVPVSTIRNTIKEGCTYDKMAATLKKYFGLKTSPEEIKNALREYNHTINEIE